MSKIHLVTFSVAARTAWCARKEEKVIAAAETSVIKHHVTIVVSAMQGMVSRTHLRMLLSILERHSEVLLKDPRSIAKITAQKKKTATCGSIKS